MSLASELLNLAEHLSTRERRRPKQASLRRSVSTSYYALFHLLTSEAAAIIGSQMNINATRKMQRWFDHGEMKRVCGMFSTAEAPKQITSLLGSAVSVDLQTVARAFIRLQEARHDADYDLETTWTKVTAQEFMQISKDAAVAWSTIRRAHEANVFALALLSSKLFDRER
ncbi:MAG: hypothetical protein HIU91_13110 [Acidobacteria bacterium]|nr:hypothetical protein [Acidobacteriota bacterium]